MPRQPRLSPSGYPVHVVHRGINRGECFVTDADYLRYLHLLTVHARACACAVHAYALMSNHVHLLLTPGGESSTSLLMKHVAQRYAQYANRARGRSGPLWEGRYKSSVVADDAYLIACHRYIELNPVRAGLVAHPGDYAWSSYCANAGLAQSALVKHHPIYIGLASHDEACAQAYRRLFDAAPMSDKADEIRIALARGLPLGRRDRRLGFAAAFRGRIEAELKSGSDPKEAGV